MIVPFIPPSPTMYHTVIREGSRTTEGVVVWVAHSVGAGVGVSGVGLSGVGVTGVGATVGVGAGVTVGVGVGVGVGVTVGVGVGFESSGG